MSDQKPKELKPCLHCNKTPELPADWMDLAYTEDLDEFAIRCSPGCGATGPIVELPEGIDDLEDYQNFSLILGELVKAWNRRGEQPKPPMPAPGAVDKEKLLAGLENLYAISGDDSQCGIGEVLDLIETGKFDLPSAVPADLTKEEKL